jgi:hypothetical protein
LYIGFLNCHGSNSWYNLFGYPHRLLDRIIFTRLDDGISSAESCSLHCSYTRVGFVCIARRVWLDTDSFKTGIRYCE